jgi:hypothetical protein
LLFSIAGFLFGLALFVGSCWFWVVAVRHCPSFL